MGWELIEEIGPCRKMGNFFADGDVSVTADGDVSVTAD